MRPVKPIDWKLVDELLMAGCTGMEIAPHFDMHEHTFYDRVSAQYGMRFTEYASEKRFKGDSILRAKQFESAVKDKNTTMLIWLGKVRLEQREPEVRAHVHVVQAFDAQLEIVKPEVKQVEDASQKDSADPQ